MPSSLLSAVMCAGVMAAGLLLGGLTPWLRLLVQIGCGMILYVLLAWALRMESFCYLAGVVRERLHQGSGE